jgi:hypothetical protein
MKLPEDILLGESLLRDFPASLVSSLSVSISILPKGYLNQLFFVEMLELP